MIVNRGSGWDRYGKALQERFFEVRKPNGSVFLTYIKDKLKHYTLGEIINMMKVNDETTFCITCGVKNKKVRSLLLDDDISI